MVGPSGSKTLRTTMPETSAASTPQNARPTKSCARLELSNDFCSKRIDGHRRETGSESERAKANEACRQPSIAAWVGVIGQICQHPNCGSTCGARPERPGKQANSFAGNTSRHQSTQIPQPERQCGNERDSIEIVGERRDVRRENDNRQHEPGREGRRNSLQEGDNPTTADKRLIVRKAPDFGARHGRAYPDR